MTTYILRKLEQNRWNESAFVYVTSAEVIASYPKEYWATSNIHRAREWTTEAAASRYRNNNGYFADYEVSEFPS